MGTFLAELKRRHIYRVAAAYTVVAWVLLQLVNNIAPGLNLPNWAVSLVIVLLAAGFPVALVFAWIHELKAPPSDATTVKAATTKVDYVLAGALVVVIALVSYQQLTPTSRAGTAPQGSVTAVQTAPSPAGAISIAVLPFANMSGDAQQEFFSDGMTEEINAALAKVPDLHVIARTSAFQFKGQNRDVRGVGQALGASHLIEGSVRKVGDRVRITTQLVRAGDGVQLWSENYDRNLTDIFAIQEDIAQAIAAALRVPLGLPQGKPLVTSRINDEAVYEDYLRAKGLVRARGGGQGLAQLTEAAKLLESVVARAPDFAPASALLAYAYTLTPTFHPAFLSGDSNQAGMIVETLLPKAEVAARHSIQLDPGSADGSIALAFVKHSQGEWLMANDLYTSGLMLDPANPDGLHFYSGMLADLGYLKRAVQMRQRLISLEPLVPVYRNVAARIILANGQAEAALGVLGKAPVGTSAAPIYAFQGRYLDAADALSTATRDLYVPGTVEAAVQLLRKAPSHVPSPEMLPRLGYMGFAYVYVGAQSRVLDWYEDNVKIGYVSGANIAILWGPDYAGIRKTERFKAYARKAGLVGYWRARGWPDLCRPVGADDFVCG